MTASLTDLLEDVTDIAGLGLSEPQAKRYINEGYTELCVRSHWSKATVSIGPSVADQLVYDFAANMRLPLTVWVNGVEYDNTDQSAERFMIRGDIDIMGDGAWWIEYGTTPGQRQIGIYPALSGATITVQAVCTPTQLVNDGDTTIVPADFNQAIVDYVAGFALGRQEDLIEDREYHKQKFDDEVARLYALNNELEGGQGHAQVLLKGVHW